RLATCSGRASVYLAAVARLRRRWRLRGRLRRIRAGRTAGPASSSNGHEDRDGNRRQRDEADDDQEEGRRPLVVVAAEIHLAGLLVLRVVGFLLGPVPRLIRIVQLRVRSEEHTSELQSL